MVALLINEVFSLGILAPGIFNRYFGGVFGKHVAQFDGTLRGHQVVRKGESHGTGAVVYLKLRA